MGGGGGGGAEWQRPDAGMYRILVGLLSLCVSGGSEWQGPGAGLYRILAGLLSLCVRAGDELQGPDSGLYRILVCCLCVSVWVMNYKDQAVVPREIQDWSSSLHLQHQHGREMGIKR